MGRHNDRNEWVARARRLVAPVRPILYRTRPFSVLWGHERGTPIDRIYIEEFLARHRDDIGGRVLEVADHDYTDRFGAAVTSADVLDIDPANERATIVADLAHAESIADESFDCFILTQTLQYIPRPQEAIRHAHRILAPSGVLLATVPSIIRVDPEGADADRWRFTEVSALELFGESFGTPQTEVSSAGNVLAAIAFLTGLAAEEFGSAKLAVRDPAFPVVICVRAVKRASPH
jgi:SAM-dependent methyltransferase